MPFFAIQANGATLWLTAQPGVGGGIWDEGSEVKHKPLRETFESRAAFWSRKQFFYLGNDSLDVAFSTIGCFGTYQAADAWRMAFLQTVPAAGRLIRMTPVPGAGVPTWNQWFADGVVLNVEELPSDKATALPLMYTAKVPGWTVDTNYIPSLQGVGVLSDGNQGLLDDYNNLLTS